MSDDRTGEAKDLPEDEELDAEEVPETAGPVEQPTPGSGALGRPDFSANPFGGHPSVPGD